MKNKAFTLVEMLAVVIILSLFGVIGIISVESIIKKGTEKAYFAQIAELKNAAENLVKTDGEPTWCQDEDVCFISLRYLAFNKYIKLKNQKYVVKNGETLETILRDFNITQAELESYNNLSEIRPGAEIIIPATREYGDYINPRTDKSFSLETVVMVKKYGENYIFEAYDSLETLNLAHAGYYNQAKKDVLKAAALIYKEKGLCANESNCSLRTSDLTEKNLLEKNFYNEVDITIDSNNQVNIG